MGQEAPLLSETSSPADQEVPPHSEVHSPAVHIAVVQVAHTARSRVDLHHTITHSTKEVHLEAVPEVDQDKRDHLVFLEVKMVHRGHPHLEALAQVLQTSSPPTEMTIPSSLKGALETYANNRVARSPQTSAQILTDPQKPLELMNKIPDFMVPCTAKMDLHQTSLEGTNKGVLHHMTQVALPHSVHQEGHHKVCKDLEEISELTVAPLVLQQDINKIPVVANPLSVSVSVTPLPTHSNPSLAVIMSNPPTPILL